MMKLRELKFKHTEGGQGNVTSSFTINQSSANLG